MTIELELQIATNTKTLPHPSQFREWISVALESHLTTAELTIRIVDEAESAQLNSTYRKKAGPTNVLSFPANIDAQFALPLLGDIVICAPIVEQQARNNNKELLAHWAHMVIHGTLHLLGYDHQQPQQADAMEQLETKLLLQLGFKAPYTNKIAYE